jgi:periplasmic protein TonB
MLNSKFDLYKPEWLELVFDDRNKEYGAYDLRRHYAKNMIVAMGITFLGLGLLCGAAIVFRVPPDTRRMITVVNDPTIHVLLPPVTPIKHVDPPKPLRTEPPTHPIATTRFVPPVVVPDPIAQSPVVNAQIKGAISQIDTKGPVGPAVLPEKHDDGGTAPSKPDVTVHTLTDLDAMPEPIGGEKAWAKFLNKNLRFPYEAQQNGVSGRVILSFIIEKDGSLSNIVIERGAGNGFDEEALRVLKLAKAWKPGQQNGLPVRVKYDIPINFQLSSEER